MRRVPVRYLSMKPGLLPLGRGGAGHPLWAPVKLTNSISRPQSPPGMRQESDLVPGPMVLINLLGNFLKFVAVENNDLPVFNLNDARPLP